MRRTSRNHGVSDMPDGIRKQPPPQPREIARPVKIAFWRFSFVKISVHKLKMVIGYLNESRDPYPTSSGSEVGGGGAAATSL